MRHYVHAAMRELSENGAFPLLKKTLRILSRDCKELYFDLRWGVKTRSVAADRKSQPVPAGAENFPYESISTDAFAKTMQSICHLSLPELFIDMGCGKGRALLSASEYGFRRIIGVELDLDLKREAERNIEQSRIQERKEVTVEVVHCNAKAYTFPDEDAVIFYHNPFGEAVMAATLQNIRRTVQSKRERYIVYQHAVHESLLSNREEFMLLVKREDYSVYRVIS
jgi:predicted RNA methylase